MAGHIRGTKEKAISDESGSENVTISEAGDNNYKHGLDVNVVNGAGLITRHDVDSGTATTEYIGRAEPGVATATAGWQILRKTVSGTQTIWLLADGNSLFDNVWDDRESLSYS